MGAMSRTALAGALLTVTAPAHATSMLVFDLESQDLPASELATLSEELRAELARFEGLQIISKNDIVRLLGVEQQRQRLDAKAVLQMTELAGALGAERLVCGTIGRVGEHQLVQLQLIDAPRAQVLRRASHAAGQTDLVAGVRAAARKLMEVGSTLHLVNQVDGAEVYLADKLVGTLPLKPFAVQESGPVRLRVEHVDYAPYEGDVVMTPGQTTRHILQLHRYTDLALEAESRRLRAYGALGAAALGYGVSATFFAAAQRAYADYQALDPRRTDAGRITELEDRTRARVLWGGVAAGVSSIMLSASLYWLLHNPAEERLAQAGATGGSP